MESLIIKYVEENIPEELKDKFINAAIHFIIDEELCSESDIERIENRKKDTRLKEVDDCLKLSATYGYIIYRTIAFDLLEEELQVEYCKLLLELSRVVSNYIVMESDEEEFIISFKQIISKLGISTACNKLVLEKFKAHDDKNIQWEATNEF